MDFEEDEILASGPISDQIEKYHEHQLDRREKKPGGPMNSTQSLGVLLSLHSCSFDAFSHEFLKRNNGKVVPQANVEMQMN